MKFLGFMWNPLSWVMEAAAIMAIALANGGVRRLFLHSNLFKVPLFCALFRGDLILGYIFAGKASRLAGFCGYHHLADHQLNN